MARLLQLSKKAARALIVNAARSDQTKDLRTSVKYRRLQRKFESYCEGYYSQVTDIEKRIEDAKLEHPANSVELAEAARKLNLELRAVTNTVGDEAAGDENGLGILLENEEFNFLKSKVFDIKGIPSEGESGEVWEYIFTALEEAEEVKIKAVKDDERTAV